MKKFLIFEFTREYEESWSKLQDEIIKISNSLELVVVGRASRKYLNDHEYYKERISSIRNGFDWKKEFKFVSYPLGQEIIDLLKSHPTLSSWVGTGFEDPSFKSDHEVILMSQCAGSIVFLKDTVSTREIIKKIGIHPIDSLY